MPRIKAVSMVEIQDDLTGEARTLPETEIGEILVTLPGSKDPRTLTLTPETATAFAAMLDNPTTEHRKAFAALFGPAAPAPAPARKRGKAKAGSDADRNSAIRKWVENNRAALGIKEGTTVVGARGRIPAAWVTAYEAANGPAPAASDPAAPADSAGNGQTGQAASPGKAPRKGRAASPEPAAAAS